MEDSPEDLPSSSVPATSLKVTWGQGYTARSPKCRSPQRPLLLPPVRELSLSRSTKEAQTVDCVPGTAPQNPQLQVAGYFTQTPSAPSEKADIPPRVPQDDSPSSQAGQPVIPVPGKVLGDTVRYPAANLRLLGQEVLRTLPD